MTPFFSTIYLRHKNFWTKERARSLVGAVFLFIIALLIQHVAYNYIDNRVIGTPVGDILLNNLPTVNLDFFIVQGALISTFIIIVLLIAMPRYVLFSIKALSLFLIIRSFFISLTHLGVNLHQLVLNQNAFGFGIYNFLYNAKNDFFFSGHVGAAFLFALIFRRQPFWRYFFFAVSGIFGVSMILAHMHYSIDVFAAPFITYSIFVISAHIFKKDFALL
jgi:hypothetical protein